MRYPLIKSVEYDTSKWSKKTWAIKIVGLLLVVIGSIILLWK